MYTTNIKPDLRSDPLLGSLQKGQRPAVTRGVRRTGEGLAPTTAQIQKIDEW